MQYGQTGPNPTGASPAVQPNPSSAQISTPPGTDPFTTAAAAQGQQANANINAQTVANRANQINPFGSSEWTQDPTTGQWTQNVSLNPASQGALDSQQQLQAGRMQGAQDLLPGAISSISQPLDTSKLTQLFSLGGMTPGGYNQQAQSTFQQLQQPLLDQRRQAVETQLANQGITRGSAAWQQAQDQLARDENNANLQGIQAGFQQGNTEFGQGLSLASATGAQRAGQIGEQEQLQQEPLSNINALVNGQSVTSPTFGQYGQAGVAAAPNYLGAAQSNYNAGLDQENLSADQSAQLMNGLFGLGGNFLQTGTGQNLLGSAGSYLGSLFGFGG